MNQESEYLELSLSKTRVILVILGSFLFVSLGILFICYPEKIANSFHGNSIHIIIAGSVTILFFALGIIFGLKRIYQSGPYLVLDSAGMTFSPGTKESRLIEWKKIIKLSEIRIYSQKIILVFVENPQELIDSEKNLMKKKMMQYSFNKYGAPFSLSANTFKIIHTRFLEILFEYYRKYK